MKKTKDLLSEAAKLIEAEPALLTMIEIKADAEKLHKSLQVFVEKAEEARYFTKKEYIELISALNSAKSTPDLLKSIIKQSGAKGKDKNKKIAIYAVKEGKAKELIKDITSSPEDIVRRAFLDLASLDSNEIEDAVEKMLTKAKAPGIAKAVGFDIISKMRNGEKAYDKKATVGRAMAYLKPYIDSMRNA